jgi:hypothetical protein
MTKRMLFGLAAIVLVVASLYSLSKSQSEAKQLVDQVQSDDTAGTSAASDIVNLQDYVSTHMGSSVTYTLTGSYNRAVTAAQSAAAAQTNNNGVYAAAQAACSGKTDSITQAKCNQAYLSTHLTNMPSPAPVYEPKLADYQHSLKSPAWTPDLTGSLILGVLVAIGLFFIVKPGARR